MISALMTHLWQSTLFAIAAAVLTLAFRKNRAKVRFGLWLSASLKFFIPFAILMNLGSQIHWTPATQQIVTEYATPAVSFAVEYVAQPFSAAASSAPAMQRHTDWLPAAILALWTCGFLAIVVIRLNLWRRIRAALQASTPLDFPATVGIRSAPGLLEPGVVGLLKPILLLPEGIVDRLSPSELEAVLAHELCHVRRRDNLFATIHMMVEAVFWFHPLVWWIGARMVEERERACDEDVLNLGNQPRVYADAILSVCKLYTESPLVCVSGVTGSNIRRRIEAIMTNRSGQTLNRAKKLLLATAGLAALAGPVLIGIVIGIGHVPAILAQPPIAIPAPVVAAFQSLAQAPAVLAPQQRPPAPTQDAPVPVQPFLRYQDHRLVALFFDLGTMTADERVRARTAGVSYVQNLHPGDLATVIFAEGSQISVAQDFTDNVTQLQTAIQNIPSTNSASGVDARLANISTVAKMISGFPGNKGLMYFSSGATPAGPENQAAFRSAVEAATNAHVAIYPIDVRASAEPALQAFAEKQLQQLQARIQDESGPDNPSTKAAQAQLDELKRMFQARIFAAPSGGGRSMSVAPPIPADISQEEYNRRLAYVQEKFGSTGNVLARTYLRYGAPDQIDAPNSGVTQIWRYNYLANFHSSTEFSFSQGKGAMHPWMMNINYPPATMYEGTPVTDATLAEAMKSEDASRGRNTSMNVTAGLPVRHTSMGANPAGEPSTLTVPLDSLSGTVDILAQVKMRSPTGLPDRLMGALRDTITLAGTSQSGKYSTEFTLEAGSYVCRVLVREATTGRVFTEAINFDVR